MQRNQSLSLNLANLDPVALQELCCRLAESNREKQLQLTGLQWDTTTSFNLYSMLAQNYGLKTIDLDGAPNDDQQKMIVAGLDRNFDILKFTMTCSDVYQRKIKRILERNFQFRIAQQLLVNELTAAIPRTTPRLQNIADDIDIINHSQATADEVSEKLFHARMATQFEYPEISARIQGVADLLKKLKIAGKNNDVTALQAAAVKNMPEYVRGLIQRGADVNSVNKLGQTALLAAATRGNIEIVKILCEGGADKTITDHSGVSAFQAAVSNRWHEIAAYLAPDASPSAHRKITTRRNLIIGFNPKLFQSLPEFSPATIRNFGGGQREGFALLADYLERFSRLHPDDDKLERIAANFQIAVDTLLLPAKDKFSALNSNGVLHTMSGHIEHMVGITITKISGHNYQLMLADRAKANSSDQQKPRLRSITIPDQHIHAILNLLEQALDEDIKLAKQILFTDIPNLVNAAWQYHDEATYKPLKSGICFYGNIKPLLRHDFQQAYDAQNGLIKYKEFTRFLREALHQDYAEFAEQDDPLLFLAGKRITEKYSSPANTI